MWAWTKRPPRNNDAQGLAPCGDRTTLEVHYGLQDRIPPTPSSPACSQEITTPDLLPLIHSLPVVQINPQSLAITPRQAMERIVEYKNDPGNGYTRTLLCFMQA